MAWVGYRRFWQDSKSDPKSMRRKGRLAKMRSELANVDKQLGHKSPREFCRPCLQLFQKLWAFKLRTKCVKGPVFSGKHTHSLTP